MSQGPAASAVEVLLLRLDTGLEPPAYAQPGDAGADLRCTEDFLLEPGQRRLVGTGVAVALPDGYAAFVHPRSGLAARHGVTLVNTPGTVDAGYRGEIKVCLINTDREQAVTFTRGDRIAQLVVQPVSTAHFVPVAELPTSVRGDGGHGSTGGILSQLAAETGGRSAPASDSTQLAAGAGGHSAPAPSSSTSSQQSGASMTIPGGTA